MTDTEIRELDEILTRYPRGNDHLIPVLQEAQEKLGYLPTEAMERISRSLGVPASTIFGVVTFYAQFRLHPIGKKMIRVCRGTACHVRGSADILREIQDRLHIQPGETTPDMQYTLEIINCFGSCALAPVMVVNKDIYGRMTTKRVAEILKG